MRTVTDISTLKIPKLKGAQLLKLISLPIFVLLLLACGGEKKSIDDLLISTPPKEKVYVAFAGGGWRAHTGHSGWVMSLLNSDKNLDTAFENVGSISSNSGGSWFSTMLMYSDTFANQIQTRGMINKWDSIGWLGGQKKLFLQGSCAKKDWWDYFPCLYKSLGIADSGASYWNNVVKEIVYRDYKLNDSITLDDSHLDWAKEKPLLLASTMLTSSVVLNDTSYSWNPFNYQRYYQACRVPSKPSLNKNYGGSCPTSSTNLTPILFVSNPVKSTYKSPQFFSYQDSTSSKPTSYNLGYTESWIRKTPPTVNTMVQNPINTTQVPVRIAAAASSAAGGFASMEPVAANIPIAGNAPWTVANDLRNEALSFQLEGGAAKYVKTDGIGLQDLKIKKVVRAADGGPTDNSGVAHLISFLQLNQKDSAFNVVAFDNVTAAFNKGTVADVGVDIANLFGKGLQKPNEFCALSICVDIPTLTIFNPIALDTTKHTWEMKYNGSDDHKLVYTQYKVTTVANENYNIQAGSHGTIHAFSCIWKGAETAPYDGIDEAGVFKIYSEMLDFIGKSVQTGGGLAHLEKAFGLK